jgi:antitoxin component of RelBE/YafQ-DinJ toxin-antitoxin module
MSIRNKENLYFDDLNAPIPGHSLTTAPGKWPWENPPSSANPEQVVSKIVDKLEKPSVQDRLTRLMLAGVSVQEITNTISLGGFTKGEFSPDVAELIKPAVVVYITKIALDKGIPVKVFNNDDKEREADDTEMLDAMRENNPEVFNAMIQGYEQEKQMPQMQEQEMGFIDLQPKQEEEVKDE